jgi:succinate dehydrogenase/fumarate reductase flavoprotein subunit
METRAATRTNVCNVLIIGSGAAGLRAAIAAHQAGVKALVIGMRQRLDAHTELAAGGINAALGVIQPCASPEGSSATWRVMRTDEDLMIPRHTRELIEKSN